MTTIGWTVYLACLLILSFAVIRDLLIYVREDLEDEKRSKATWLVVIAAFMWAIWYMYFIR